MRPLDECLLRKKSGGIVTDGLVLWIDSADGLFYSDGSQIPFGETKQVLYDGVHFKNRIDETLIEFEDYGVASSKYRTANVVCTGDYFSLSTASVPSGSAGYMVGFKCPELTDTVLTSEILISYLQGRTQYRTIRVGNINSGSSVFSVLFPSNQNVGNYKLTTDTVSYFNETPLLCSVNAYDSGIKKRIYKNGTVYLENSNNMPNGDYFIPDVYITGSTAYSNVIRFSSIRFYNRALTEKEILQNYNYEKSLGRVV